MCCYQTSRISRSLPSRAAPISQDPPDQLRSNTLFAVLTGVSPEICVYTFTLSTHTRTLYPMRFYCCYKRKHRSVFCAWHCEIIYLSRHVQVLELTNTSAVRAKRLENSAHSLVVWTWPCIFGALGILGTLELILKRRARQKAVWFGL